MRDAGEQRAHALARRTENDETRLQAAWPARVQLRVPEREKLFARLPWLFAEAFAPIAEEPLRALALAAKLLRASERVRTYPPAPSPRSGRADGRLAAMHTEALAAFASAVGAAPDAWSALRLAEARFAHARDAEDRFAAARRDLAACDDATLREHAAANGVGIRTALAGVATLAGGGPTAAFAASIDHWCAARAIAEGLANRHDDLAAHRPSLTLALLARTAPAALDAARDGDARALTRALVAEGVARAVLAAAVAEADAADRVVADIPGGATWRAAMAAGTAPMRTLLAEFSAERAASA